MSFQRMTDPQVGETAATAEDLVSDARDLRVTQASTRMIKGSSTGGSRRQRFASPNSEAAMPECFRRNSSGCSTRS